MTPGTSLIRPILWFAAASTINIVCHEAAHALTAYALGVNATLYNFWVSLDRTEANVGARAVIGVAGPLFSLILGAVCWFLLRRYRYTAAGLPLAYVSAWGVSIFFGNLMSTSFVGDFSIAAALSGLPMPVRYAASLAGIVGLAATLFAAGRELRRLAPASLTRAAAAATLVVLPAAVGTLLIVFINYSTPLPGFAMTRVVEGSTWLCALAGAMTGRPDSAASGSGLRLRALDAGLAVTIVAIARVLAPGIAFTP